MPEIGRRHPELVSLCVRLIAEGATRELLEEGLRAEAKIIKLPKREDDEVGRLIEWAWSSKASRAVRIEKRAETLRINREAEVLLQREIAGPPYELPPPGRTFAVQRQEERTKLEYTVQGLHVEGFNTEVLAQRETGKTRLMMNLARSLADGVPFLDYFDVNPNGRRILYMNYELMPDLWCDWMDAVGIENADMIVPLHLQGETFRFWDAEQRSRFIEWMIENDIGNLIVDPAMRAWRGYVVSSNDNDQVGAFLYGELDGIKKDANVPNLWLPHHIGKSWRQEGMEEGAAAHQMEAWRDQGWILSKNKDGVRSLRAEGRGGESSALVVEPARGMKLTTYGERASEARREADRLKVLRALANGPLNKTALRDEASVDKNRIDGLIRTLVKDDAVERTYTDGTRVDESQPKSGVPIMHNITSGGLAEIGVK